MKTAILLTSILCACAAPAASIEGSSFEISLTDLELFRASVTGASAVDDIPGAAAIKSVAYYCRLSDAHVFFSEGDVALPALGPDELNVWMQQFTDEKFSAECYVFQTTGQCAVQYVLGAPIDGRKNITTGLVVSVRSSSPRAVASVLRDISAALTVFVGRPIAPKRFEAIPAYSLIPKVVSFLESSVPNQALQPTATAVMRPADAGRPPAAAVADL